MRVEQSIWSTGRGWEPASPEVLSGDADLVLAFSATAPLVQGEVLADLRRRYPGAILCACSTAGEIAGTRVLEGSTIATAVKFGSSRVRAAQVRLPDLEPDSFAAGRELALALQGGDPPAGDLVHLLVLSDGLCVNGSELACGLTSALPAGITVTGGLSGDGTAFQRTLVGLAGAAQERLIVAIGFYGSRLKVGYGSMGGWDPFGPERRITRAQGNVLYELDGQSALALYKRYLGEHAGDLPASALLFPLSLRSANGQDRLVRTVLAIDEEAQSMTFAGAMPEGEYARLMKANFDRLIDGATGAAQATGNVLGGAPPELAILISCVGRRLVLRQRVEEEVESAQAVLGSQAVLAGFYSYGEIAPFAPWAGCELHNQTMTITAFCET